MTGFDGDHAVLVVSIHKVKHVTRITLDPLHIRRCTVARHDTDPRANLRLPGKGRLAFHCPIHVAGDRHNREDNVVLGHHKIVHHGRVRRLEHMRLCHVSLFVHPIKPHIITKRTRRHIGMKKQFSGNRIDFWVRRHGGVQLAIEAP